MSQANDKDNEPGNPCSRKAPGGNAAQLETKISWKIEKETCYPTILDKEQTSHTIKSKCEKFLGKINRQTKMLQKWKYFHCTEVHL